MSKLGIRTAPADGSGPPEISKRAVIVAVAARGGPNLLEATVIPGVLFYLCLLWAGLGVAYIVCLAWVYGCVGRRLMFRQAIPGVLILGAIGITVRTAVAVASGSAFIYFIQPVILTVITGGVFFASLLMRRPLVGRLADDFWPITPEMQENPRITSLFRGLTALWAGVNIVTAAVTFTLLLWLPLALFLVVKQLSGFGITAAAVAVTVVWSHRTACREGVVTAPVSGR